jgi:hypothetical protein
MGTMELRIAGRRWLVGCLAGGVFDDSDDFGGITLTIELRPCEAAAVATAMLEPGAAIIIGGPEARS